jgi:hypothetical protein
LWRNNIKLTVVLSHVLAETRALSDRFNMKATICEISVSAEIDFAVENQQEFNIHGYNQKNELNP